MAQRTATTPTTPEQIQRLVTLALESSLEDGEMREDLRERAGVGAAITDHTVDADEATFITADGQRYVATITVTKLSPSLQGRIDAERQQARLAERTRLQKIFREWRARGNFNGDNSDHLDTVDRLLDLDY
jgi:hypothetical protein